MKVKNISGQKLSIVGVGTVDIDEEVTVDSSFNNANFVKVEKKPKVKTEIVENEPVKIVDEEKDNK